MNKRAKSSAINIRRNLHLERRGAVLQSSNTAQIVLAREVPALSEPLGSYLARGGHGELPESGSGAGYEDSESDSGLQPANLRLAA